MWLRRRYAPLRFSAGGATVELPARASEILTMWSSGATPQLAFDIGTVLATCHFFAVEEIEFSVAPAAVTGQSQLDSLAEFLHGLARATGKPALLTPENWPQAPILRADPASDDVAYLPPPAPTV